MSTSGGRRARALRRVLSVSLAVLCTQASGCLIARQPPPGADGPTIYSLQLCGNCHGDNGEGKPQGPPLRGLRELWTASDLADFIRDPDGWEAKDERLRKLSSDYSGDMASYANLSVDERTRLADYLLSL